MHRVLIGVSVVLAGVGALAVVTHDGDAFPDRPPDGWYLVMDLWPTSREFASEPEERAWVEGMAETARRFGFPDARVWPQPAVTGGCRQPNPVADGSVESNCAGATSRSGYTVVLEGPYSQPAEASPDRRFEWRRRTWQEKLATVEARQAPFGVLPAIYLFSEKHRTDRAEPSALLPVRVDAEARVLDGRELPDGWYVAFFPGAFTSDSTRALYAARAMAWRARQAGYDDLRIVRWPTGPATCKPWGCEDRRPIVAYVVVAGSALPGPTSPDQEEAWRAAATATQTVTVGPEYIAVGIR